MNQPFFDDAIQRLGGPAKAAEALGESIQTIINWRRRGAVPANCCKEFERLTGVSVKFLRDDWAIYWPDPGQDIPAARTAGA